MRNEERMGDVITKFKSWARAWLVTPALLLRRLAEYDDRWNRLFALVPAGQKDLVTALVYDRQECANRFTPVYLDVGSAIGQISNGLERGDFVIGEDTPVYIGYWYWELSQGVAEGLFARYAAGARFDLDNHDCANGPDEYQRRRINQCDQRRAN